MKEAIKKRWLEALNSGEYNQTTGRLKRESGFCCLGVLCDLYSKEKNEEWYAYSDYHFEFLGSPTLLPLAVRRWAGIEEGNPSVSYKRPTSLAQLNDRGKTFKQIAKVIKKYL